MKILFTGASGVGKTTLVNIFIKNNPDYKRTENFTREFRDYLNFPINENVTNESQYAITSMHAYQIVKNDDIISDRSLVDFLVWTKMSKNISKKQYKKHKEDFLKYIKKEDVVHFYIPVEFEVKDDKYRSLDESYRRKIDKKIKKFLKKNEIPYYELTGSIAERYQKMMMHLETEEVFFANKKQRRIKWFG